jgi:hypothetical protein
MFARSGPPKRHVPMRKIYKFYLRLSHSKVIAEKAAESFFFLTSSLIFEMPIPGGSAKKTVVLIFWYLLHSIFSKKYVLLYGRFQGSHFFISYLFCLLKSY